VRFVAALSQTLPSFASSAVSAASPTGASALETGGEVTSVGTALSGECSTLLFDWPSPRTSRRPPVVSDPRYFFSAFSWAILSANNREERLEPNFFFFELDVDVTLVDCEDAGVAIAREGKEDYKCGEMGR